MNARLPICAAIASLSLVACASDPTPVQRDAVIGGAIGAAAGAAIAKNDVEGALIGGAIGAGIGAYTGCHEQGGCYVSGKEVASNSNLIYDRAADRFYYVDRSNGRSYWQNGDYRG